MAELLRNMDGEVSAEATEEGSCGEKGATATAERGIFGGAICVSVPKDWIDTDAFIDIVRRPVPDNQEIFMALGAIGPEGSQRPMALFIDLLEVPEDVPIEQSVEFHAKEILLRDERESELEQVTEDATSEAQELDALDKGMAFSGTFPTCDLQVCVIRIPSVSTDIVLSLHGTIAQDSEVKVGEIARSFNIVDWGLFAGS